MKILFAFSQKIVRLIVLIIMLLCSTSIFAKKTFLCNKTISYETVDGVRTLVESINGDFVFELDNSTFTFYGANGAKVFYIEKGYYNKKNNTYSAELIGHGVLFLKINYTRKELIIIMKETDERGKVISESVNKIDEIIKE